jgi:hypothetical protein
MFEKGELGVVAWWGVILNKTLRAGLEKVTLEP